jgi:hypothetical protein
VESLLVDAEWQKRTSEWIADACHVSEVYVWKLKGGKNVNPNIRIEKSIPEEQAPNPESPKENGEKSTSSVKKSRKKEKERDTRRD